MKIKNRIRTGIVLLALALGLTACGGSSSSTASSAASSASSEAASSETTAVSSEAAESESTPANSSSSSENVQVIDGVTFIIREVPNDKTGN